MNFNIGDIVKINYPKAYYIVRIEGLKTQHNWEKIGISGLVLCSPHRVNYEGTHQEWFHLYKSAKIIPINSVMAYGL